MDLEQEYSAKAATDRERRVRELRKREQMARARSAQPIEQPDELAVSIKQLADRIGAKVTRK